MAHAYSAHRLRIASLVRRGTSLRNLRCLRPVAQQSRTKRHACRICLSDSLSWTIRKQSVGSTIHCVAGDATGIVLAAAITATLGLPMWLDLIVEYCSGFAFGLFIFQSLFMKGVMGGTYWENVRKTFAPEFISMNCMMAGMAPVMTFLMMGRDMRAMDPKQLLFWGVMSVGVTAGFSTA